MGIISFIKDAGKNIFGSNKAEAAEDREKQIKSQLEKYNISGVYVSVNDDIVNLSGKVSTPLEKRRAVMIAGNIEGISSVDDKIMLSLNGQEIQKDINVEQEFYTVEKGDTLSGISKQVYGDASKYNAIFEANTPMLEDADKIYPGQKLIIPELKD